MVFLAGKSPDIRPYTVYIHSSGQPYIFSTIAHNQQQNHCSLLTFLAAPTHNELPRNSKFVCSKQPTCSTAANRCCVAVSFCSEAVKSSSLSGRTCCSGLGCAAGAAPSTTSPFGVAGAFVIGGAGTPLATVEGKQTSSCSVRTATCACLSMSLQRHDFRWGLNARFMMAEASLQQRATHP